MTNRRAACPLHGEYDLAAWPAVLQMVMRSPAISDQASSQSEEGITKMSRDAWLLQPHLIALETCFYDQAWPDAEAQLLLLA